jgi:hypothetical protein
VHLEFNHNDIPKFNTQPIENTSNNGDGGSKCGCGKYQLQPSTKVGLVLQHAERSQREEDE